MGFASKGVVEAQKPVENQGLTRRIQTQDSFLNLCVCVFLFREWYSYHFPELVKIVPDNYMYARVAQFVKSRKDLTEDSVEGLEEIVMDSAVAKAIYDASRSSMGE